MSGSIGFNNQGQAADLRDLQALSGAAQSGGAAGSAVSIGDGAPPPEAQRYVDGRPPAAPAALQHVGTINPEAVFNGPPGRVVGQIPGVSGQGSSSIPSLGVSWAHDRSGLLTEASVAVTDSTSLVMRREQGRYVVYAQEANGFLRAPSDAERAAAADRLAQVVQNQHAEARDPEAVLRDTFAAARPATEAGSLRASGRGTSSIRAMGVSWASADSYITQAKVSVKRHDGSIVRLQLQRTGGEYRLYAREGNGQLRPATAEERAVGERQLDATVRSQHAEPGDAEWSLREAFRTAR